MTFWATCVFLLAILAFAVARARSRARRTAGELKVKNSYQSVTVEWRLNACDAVKQLDGQRFVGSEAPGFPLPECDAEHCECRYRFHADRREGERRIPHGMRYNLIIVNASEEKRSPPDRRYDDSEHVNEK